MFIILFAIAPRIYADARYYAGKLLDYKEAVHVALEELARRPEGQPDVTVLIFPEVPDDVSQREYADAAHAAGEGVGKYAMRAFIEDITSLAFGINIVVKAHVSSSSKVEDTYFLKNLVGDDVLVVPTARQDSAEDFFSIERPAFHSHGLDFIPAYCFAIP